MINDLHEDQNVCQRLNFHLKTRRLHILTLKSASTLQNGTWISKKRVELLWAFTEVSNFINPNSFMKDTQEMWSNCQNCIKVQSRLNHQVAFLSALLRDISMSHSGVSESSWLQSPPRNWTGTGLIPATARRPCARRRIPSAAAPRRGWVCQLSDCGTTRRIINKWFMKNYIYPWQPVRCVGVSRKLSVWFHFSFVGHSFMLLQFLTHWDVWLD